MQYTARLNGTRMPVNKNIPFYVPWITEQDKKAVLEALESRWLTGGPKSAEFESQFADYVGVKHAISVNNCTAALHLAMRAANVKSGDEVIVPDITFAATANAAIFCGAKPVLCDIDEKTLNISIDDLAERITSKTRAIIPVHYAGQPCDMSEILEIAEHHKVSIVEDCAHSLGATYKGQQTGSLGLMGCFSFYPTKMITTLQGGMITTNDDKIAEKTRSLREHAMSRTAISRETDATWYYDVTDLGYNYRLTEVQVALGISQMKRINNSMDRHVKAARHYTKKLRTLKGIITPYEAPNRTHVFHLYVIKVKKEAGITRNMLFQKLSNEGIGLSVHYTPLHLLSYYRKFLKKKDSFPVATRVYDEILSLPLYPTLTYKDVDFVTTKMKMLMVNAPMS